MSLTSDILIQRREPVHVLQNRATRVTEGIKYDEPHHPKILRSLNVLNVHQLVLLDLTPHHTKKWFPKRSTIHSYYTRAAKAGNFDIPKVKTEKTK